MEVWTAPSGQLRMKLQNFLRASVLSPTPRTGQGAFQDKGGARSLTNTSLRNYCVSLGQETYAVKRRREARRGGHACTLSTQEDEAGRR
jgi:hypothetical protein